MPADRREVPTRMATGSCEFWNLVFMQYDQVSPDERIDLPRPSIDTGMGLERMSAIMQGVTSSFDIDLFQTIYPRHSRSGRA